MKIKKKRITQPSFTAAKDLIRSCFKTVERWYEKKERVTGVATGYTELDEMTSGLQPSDLIVIAGRPVMGKTALAMGIAQHLGIEKRGTVVIFGLEMSKEQFMFRFLCSEARVDVHKMRAGFLVRSDWPKLTMAVDRIAKARIFIDDMRLFSISKIHDGARWLKAEDGLDLIILDGLHWFQGRGDPKNRERQLPEICRSLKALAEEFRIPVIITFLLSPAVKQQTDKLVALAELELADCEAIEPYADLIIFIHRGELYHPTPTYKNREIVDITIGKQRNGPTGRVQLAFLNRYIRFENLEEGDMPV